MKKVIFIAFLILTATLEVSAQQFKVITSVESIVPNGVGRSRIVNTMEKKTIKNIPQPKRMRTKQETNLIAVRFV